MRSLPQPRLLAAGILVVLCLENTPSAAQSWPEEMYADARLNDVFFLDSDRGWAVGDRGTVLFTDDSGRTWRRRAVGVAGELRSVWFTDATHGWIVGGEIHRFSHRSTAVILRTQDGGRTWEPVPNLPIARCLAVHFHDPRHGWVVTDPSTLFPTNVFRTTDGGRVWSPVPSGKNHVWHAAQFPDHRRAILVGRDAAAGIVVGTELREARMPDVGKRHVRDVQMVDPLHGWLVGDGGLLLFTADGGLSWQTPQAFPKGFQLFDFQSVAVNGPHVWIAGTPGSIVFHSADAGRSWQAALTEHLTPLTRIVFHDANRGWAVGAFGAILGSRDGGRTWHRQRTGGQRASLLAVVDLPTAIPFEVFASASGQDGHLGVVELLTRPWDDDPALMPSLDDRTHAAATETGASYAQSSWQFPSLPASLKLPMKTTATVWQQSSGGKNLDDLRELVVRRIRQWRPDVIVTGSPAPRQASPLSEATGKLVLQAVEDAADPNAFAEQIALAGLSPWNVAKTFETTELANAHTKVSGSQLIPKFGRSVSEQAARARGLIGDVPGPDVIWSYRLLRSNVPTESARRSLFAGLAVSSSSESRRESKQPPPLQLNTVRRAAQKRNSMQKLLTSQTGVSLAALPAQIDDLVAGLFDEPAGEVLFHLADHLRQTSRPDQAAEVLVELLRRYPGHELSEFAMVWLVRYHGSEEMSHWKSSRSSSPVVQASGVSADENRAARTSYRGTFGRDDGVVQTSKTNVSNVTGVARALSVGQLIRQSNPALYSDPRVRFPLVVAARNAGRPRESERYFQSLSSNPGLALWQRCAAGEIWLTHGRTAPPKAMLHCGPTDERPRLDGRLDERFWKAARTTEVRQTPAGLSVWPTRIWSARDDRYLYVAARCTKAEGTQYPPASFPRPRDPDLSDRDRIDLLIDVDRDHATWYRLTVDHNGWTGEACWGDRNWNPAWYVAAESDLETWTVEIAIPLAELTSKRPSASDVWSLGIRRWIPGVGIQTWTVPASPTASPAAFGWMVFGG